MHSFACSKKAMVENLKVIEHLGNSDHNMVTRLICKVPVGIVKTGETISQNRL
jgi:hypothetical protein